MSQDDLYINGELLRLGREARGWVIGDMATRACMSVKQIRQLEEGGTSAFYSPAVKMTSAKKLAGILELSPEQVFNRPGTVEAETVPVQQAASEEEPHTDGQPAEVQATARSQLVQVVETPAAVDESASPAAAEEPKGKTSIWLITTLFVAAIGVAAYMHQQEEPVTEPPPPLQVLPVEADPAASAASAAIAADAAASNASAAVPVPSAAAAPAASAPAAAASAASKPL